MSLADPTDLAAEAEAAETKVTDARNAAATETDDLAWLMSSPRGRRIIWRILEGTGLNRDGFTGNSETFFNAGKRRVGLDLQGKVAQAAARDFLTMMQEHFRP